VEKIKQLIEVTVFLPNPTRIRGCNQNFPDWQPGERTANGISCLPLGAVV